MCNVCSHPHTVSVAAVLVSHSLSSLHPHRPDWSRCADYYSDSGSGGGDKWRSVAEGKSSDYLVDVLLARIAGVDVSDIRKDDNFQAMVGSAPSLHSDRYE